MEGVGLGRRSVVCEADFYQLKSGRTLANTGGVSELNSIDSEFPMNANAFVAS